MREYNLVEVGAELAIKHMLGGKRMLRTAYLAPICRVGPGIISGV
jgi:hypothetical protein